MCSCSLKKSVGLMNSLATTLPEKSPAVYVVWKLVMCLLSTYLIEQEASTVYNGAVSPGDLVRKKSYAGGTSSVDKLKLPPDDNGIPIP